MPRPGRELAIAHGTKFPAQGLLGDDDPELLPYPLTKIDEAPAHDAMGSGDRPALDYFHNRCPLRVVEPRGLAGRLAVDQARWPLGVEPHHPVPNDLQRHVANPGCLRARRPIINRRQGQQPTGLWPILDLAGNGMQPDRVKIPT